MSVAQFLTQLAESFEHPSVPAQWAGDRAACAKNARRCRDFATIALLAEDEARRAHARLSDLFKQPRAKTPRAQQASATP